MVAHVPAVRNARITFRPFLHVLKYSTLDKHQNQQKYAEIDSKLFQELNSFMHPGCGKCCLGVCKHAGEWVVVGS